MVRTIVTMISFCLLAVATLVSAEDHSEFRVYVMQSKVAGCAKPDRIPPDANVLFSGQEVEKLDWAEQTFLLNDEATKRLLSNASDLQREDNEDFVPRGQFPDSGGKAFTIVLKGKIVLSGIVVDMSLLQHPPDCPLLYPDLPMIDHGKLVLGVGLPRKQAELHEDFFKILVEEGPASCFSPVLPEEVRGYFQKK